MSKSYSYINIFLSYQYTMPVDHSNILALYILTIITLIVIAYGWLYESTDVNVTYPLWQVSNLPQLNDSLSTYHRQLHRLAEDYSKTKSKSQFLYSPCDYDNDAEYLKNSPDAWLPHWNTPLTRPNWYTYPIVHNHKLFPYITDKLLIDIITPHLPFIKSLGFSLISPHNSIRVRSSSKMNFLTYHYNLYGDGSLFVLDDKYTIPKSGDSLLFNASYCHSVKNGPHPKLTIYADVKYTKSKPSGFPF